MHAVMVWLVYANMMVISNFYGDNCLCAERLLLESILTIVRPWNLEKDGRQRLRSVCDWDAL
jgi:hypothetical protein